MVATALSVLIAATTTSTNFLSHFCWQLARHPDIQDKLRKEIQSVVSDEREIVDNEKVHQLEYLDMVIFEGLRLNPPAPLLTRGCSKDYTLKEGQNCTIKEGNDVLIPAAAIMTDER